VRMRGREKVGGDAQTARDATRKHKKDKGLPSILVGKVNWEKKRGVQTVN